MIKNSTRIHIHPQFVTVNKQKIVLSTLNSVINPNPLENIIRSCPNKHIHITFNTKNHTNTLSLAQLLTDIGKREQKEITIASRHTHLANSKQPAVKAPLYSRREQFGILLIALLSSITALNQKVPPPPIDFAYRQQKKISSKLTAITTRHNNYVKNIATKLTPILNSSTYASAQINSRQGSKHIVAITIPFSSLRAIEPFLNNSKMFSLINIERKAALNEITLHLEVLS
jgi:predicted ATP-dependent protease